MPNYFDKYDSIETQGNYFDKYDEQEKPQRSPLSEIGTGLKRGIIGELPRQVGQAMRWAGEENDPGFRGSLYRQGKSIADMARERLSRPENQLHPEQHGMVTNALAEGAEMLAPSVAAPLVAGGLVTATSAALPAAAVSAPVALGISALAGSLPAGMAQAQDTFERVKEAGGDEATAKSAGWKSGAIEAGGETVGTYLGGKLLGIGGMSISKSPLSAAPCSESISSPNSYPSTETRIPLMKLLRTARPRRTFSPAPASLLSSNKRRRSWGIRSKAKDLSSWASIKMVRYPAVPAMRSISFRSTVLPTPRKPVISMLFSGRRALTRPNNTWACKRIASRPASSGGGAPAPGEKGFVILSIA